jgi:arsenate reductase-like glutaredoxin family protein
MNYFSLKSLIDTGSEPFKKLYKENASIIAQVIKTVQHPSDELSDAAKLLVLRGQDLFATTESQKTIELFKPTGEEIKQLMKLHLSTVKTILNEQDHVNKQYMRADRDFTANALIAKKVELEERIAVSTFVCLTKRLNKCIVQRHLLLIMSMNSRGMMILRL